MSEDLVERAEVFLSGRGTGAMTLVRDLIARLEKAERALADVVNPLGKLIRDIEAGGGKPNELAHGIANSVTFIQSIARAALTPEGDPS